MSRIRSSPAGSDTKGRFLCILLLALAAALVLVGVAGAQSSSSFKRSQYTADGGGGWSRSAGLAIESDVGQAIVGDSGGTQYGVDSGHTHEPVAPPKMWWYAVHLPVILRSP